MPDTSFDWARPPQPKTDPAADFGWAATGQEQKPQGFMDYVGNVAKNFYKVTHVQDKEQLQQYGVQTMFSPEEQLIREQLQIAKQTGGGAGITANDFLHMFGKIFESGQETVEKITSAPGGFMRGLKHDPTGTAGQILKGLAQPIGDLFELGSRVQLSENDIRALTPEEKAERIKNVVATTAMMAVGAGVAKGLGAANKGFRYMLAAEEAEYTAGTVGRAGFLSTSELFGASRLSTKGALGQELLKKGAIASFSGATYGAVRYANESDQLAETLINGIVFAPLGPAFELLSLGKGVKENLSVSRRAGALAQLRQIQDVTNNSVDGVVNSIESLATSKNIAEGLMNGKIKSDHPIIHLMGVESAQAAKLATSPPEGYKAALHFAKEGESADVLVYKDGAGADPKFFSENGYIPDQVVGHEGNRYRVVGGNGKTLELQGLYDTEHTITVPKDEVRGNTWLERGSAMTVHEGEAGPNRAFRNITLDTPTLVDNLYGEWRTDISTPPPSELDNLRKKRTELTDQIRTASPDRLNELKQQGHILDWRIDKAEQASADPMGFDEIPTELEHQVLAPEQGVMAHLTDFLQKKNFSHEEIPLVRREFEKRLLRDAMNAEFDEHDHAAYKETFEELNKHTLAEDKITADRKGLDIERLVKTANSNGIIISDHDGTLVLRSYENNTELYRGSSRADAMKIINQTAQENGVDLDQGGVISGAGGGNGRGLPPSVAPGAQLPDPAEQFPYYRKKGYLAAANEFLNSAGTYITRNREIMTALDSKHGTSLLAKVFAPTQEAARIRSARIRPYFEKLKGIEKQVEKMSPRDRELIGEWMQTMTPDEVATKFMSRPMNAFELKASQKLVGMNLDMENLFKYRRTLERVKKGLDLTTPGGQAELEDAVGKLRTQFSIDQNHLNAVEMFDGIEEMRLNDASLGAIVRHVRATMNNEPSRLEFAKKNNLSMAQLGAASQMEAMYNDLGNVFGIPEARRLQGYMTHAKLYEEGNMIRALDKFSGETRVKEFYAKMIRTGEVTSYEKDPIRAMARYIKGGMDAQHFSTTLAVAKNALKAEVEKMPFGVQAKAMQVGETYLSDLQGHPGAAESYTNEAIGSLLKKYKMENADVSARGVVNSILAIIPASTQGLRIVSGILDFASNLALTEGRFGTVYTAKMIANGVKALNGPMRAELERLGVISVASPLNFSDPVERASSTIGEARGKALKVADATSTAMFRLSGQQDVYALLHAGHYITAKQIANEQLLKLGRGEVKWDQVRRKIKLDTYDEPVVREFINLVKTGMEPKGSMDAAAHFLAVQTGYEQVGVFGLANHPHNWGTNFGRVMGQFGNYPMWLRTSLFRMATRGTVAQRMASVARFGAASYGTMLAGQSMGLDMSRFNPTRALAFMGGPVEDILETINDAVGGYGPSRNMAQAKLKKMLPYDPSSGTFNLKQIYLPGSFFADDMAKAITRFQRGEPGAGLEQAIGLRPQKAGGF